MSKTSNWKKPDRLVWYTVACSRCRKVINRVKLPGIVQVTSHRVCDQCSAGAPARTRKPAQPQQQPRGPRPGRRSRGPRPQTARPS